MREPDVRVLKAISSLNGDPNWEAIKNWLKESYNEIIISMIKVPSDKDSLLRIFQGKAHEYYFVFNVLEKADETLRRRSEAAKEEKPQ